MVELVVVGIVAGFLAGISPCILPVVLVVLVAGTSPPESTETPARMPRAGLVRSLAVIGGKPHEKPGLAGAFVIGMNG
jgi:cytochrome c biogenesis protein CcdA